MLRFPSSLTNRLKKQTVFYSYCRVSQFPNDPISPDDLLRKKVERDLSKEEDKDKESIQSSTTHGSIHHLGK